MPNPGAESPLRKCTLNLFEADVISAEAYYGRGWTETLRKVWQEHMKTCVSYHKLRQTLGDIE
jgi:hypothetical protein